MGTIGPLAVMTGFLPQFITRCSSTYHYQILLDQEAGITEHGPKEGLTNIPKYPIYKT